MIDGELIPATTVLTAVPIASEYILPRNHDLLVRDADVRLKSDDARPWDLKAR